MIRSRFCIPRTRVVISCRLRRGLLSIAAGLLVVSAGAAGEADDAPTPAAAGAEGAARGLDRAPALRDAIDVRRRANQAAGASQERIDALSDETDALYARSSAASRQLEALNVYNERMREIVAHQETELASLAQELEQVDEVARSVSPLMLRMIDALEQFVALDLPFLTEERAERVAGLRSLMTVPGLTVSEKYRRVMEAYQAEIEYGTTIEAYRAPLQPEGDGRTVDFLRFGRIALVYLTLDGSDGGAWDARTRSWRPLPRAFIPEVRRGLQIARKQIAPDLVRLPLAAPEDDAVQTARGG